MPGTPTLTGTRSVFTWGGVRETRGLDHQRWYDDLQRQGWSHDMLLINNELVSELLTMEDCIRVQEDAFRKLPVGAAIHRPRIDMYFPCDRDDGYFRWGTMEGANDGYFAIRMKFGHHHMAEGCERQLD
jgi:hypothetical protein